mgnify:CR=1 FL=1
MKKNLLATLLFLLPFMGAKAEVDPNFYIYLCFGQSNMEGNAELEAVDKEYVDDRFLTLACTDFTSPQRKMGEWYTAYPPIVRPWTRLGMADYFGRSMVAALPAEYRVGVVDIALGGVDIKGFMSEEVEDYLKTVEDWLKNYFAAYDNDPYKRLVEMGKVAQQSGVIKGILLHQGETNNGQQDWLQKVKTIYERLLNDLDLKAEEVPLFVGEMVDAAAGGVCSLHNSVIAKVPSVIPTAHVIRSTGCEAQADNIHFTSSSYRTMGKRYAIEALNQLGRPAQVDADYQTPESLKKFFTATGLTDINDMTLKTGSSRNITVTANFEDGHKEDVTAEAVIACTGSVSASGTQVTATEEGEGTVTVTYTDFTGAEVSTTFNVSSQAGSGTNRFLAVNNGSAGVNNWDKQAICTLSSSMEVGKTYVVRADIRADEGGDCALWPIWSTSTNVNQWGGSNDVQYLAAYRLTSTFQEFTWEFKAEFPIDKLQWAFGLIGGRVCFDNVSCVEKGTDNEMVVNGDFETDNISHWAIITWAGQTLGIDEETTTAIQPVKTMPEAPACYNLNGQRMTKPGKGLYIINGKKTILK